MVTQRTAIAIAKDLAKAIHDKGFPLKKAILFGSFVRNQQHEWSDIDLALVADEFIGVGFFDIKPFVRVLSSDKKYAPVETHTFNTVYFEQGDPFIDEIKRTGIEIFPAAKKPARKKAVRKVVLPT